MLPKSYRKLRYIENESVGSYINIDLLASLDMQAIIDGYIELPQKAGIVMQTMEDGTQKVIVKKPTYSAIKRYVKEHFNANAHTLYIAQTKRKYGVDMGIAYNKPDEPKARIPKCPAEKEKMILEALKYFGVLDQSTEYMEDES